MRNDEPQAKGEYGYEHWTDLTARRGQRSADKGSGAGGSGAGGSGDSMGGIMDLMKVSNRKGGDLTDLVCGWWWIC